MKNSLVLAYLGDSIYEIYIRKYLVDSGINNVKMLQQKSVGYVSARSQRKYLEMLINENFLTDEEIDIYKRGRNAKGKSPKNTDVVTYKMATGLETLIGELYLKNKEERIKEIMDFIVGK